jgi:hypothetical protein
MTSAQKVSPVALDDGCRYAKMFHVKHCTGKNP